MEGLAPQKMDPECSFTKIWYERSGVRGLKIPLPPFSHFDGLPTPGLQGGIHGLWGCVCERILSGHKMKKKAKGCCTTAPPDAPGRVT